MNWLTRGHEDKSKEGRLAVVFLPGWGFDGRILQMINPSCPWWSPAGPLFPEAVAAELDALFEARQWPQMILVGWSLGARYALEYAALHPERVHSLVLLSLRHSWPEKELAAIRAGLTADPVAFMTDFYRKCFLGEKKAWRQFGAQLLEDRLQRVDSSMLLAGLSCLARPLAPLVERLAKKGYAFDKVWLLHGDKDIIAPIEGRCLLQGGRHLTLKNRGHALFLTPEAQTLSFLAGVSL